MKRVVIIGCAGTGKTTFAKVLADKLSLPLVHLDYYYHQKQFGYYTDKASWVEKVEQLASAHKWIIDGNYTMSLSSRLKRADTVFFLDYPRRVYLYRVVLRQLRHRKRDEMPADWEEKFSLGFLKLVFLYKKNERPHILAQLSELQNKKVIILKNPKATEDFLSTLS